MSPSADPGLTLRGSDQAGRLKLTFEVPKTIWSAGEAIDGTATLQLTDGTATSTNGPGSVGFAFQEVDGDRRVDPVLTDNCAKRAVAVDSRIESQIIKTGVPADGFSEAFLADPLVRLPPGVWDITAMWDFYDGMSCSGQRHTLSASVRLQVAD